MKLVCICGEPNSQKDLVAMKLSQNSDVIYIRPYCDKKVPINLEAWDNDGLIHLSPAQLDTKMYCEKPLAVREINDTRYVFFENQLRADYIVMIVDENTLDNLRKDKRWDIISIYCTRTSCANPQKYDVIFNPDTDDVDFLEVKLYE